MRAEERLEGSIPCGMGKPSKVACRAGRVSWQDRESGFQPFPVCSRLHDLMSSAPALLLYLWGLTFWTAACQPFREEDARLDAQTDFEMPEGSTMQERWLSVAEIAEHLGLKPDTVYKWIDRKALPAHKMGRLWKFKASEVDEWVRAGGAAPQGRALEKE